MNLIGWLTGVTNIAITLIPLFLGWACAVLWIRTRSGWALAALIGAAAGVVATITRWAVFFVHYNSVETMMAQNDDPAFEILVLTIAVSLSVGSLIASFALVGFARSLPRAAQPAVQADAAAPRGLA